MKIEYKYLTKKGAKNIDKIISILNDLNDYNIEDTRYAKGYKPKDVEIEIKSYHKELEKLGYKISYLKLIKKIALKKN